MSAARCVWNGWVKQSWKGRAMAVGAERIVKGWPTPWCTTPVYGDGRLALWRLQKDRAMDGRREEEREEAGETVWEGQNAGKIAPRRAWKEKGGRMQRVILLRRRLFSSVLGSACRHDGRASMALKASPVRGECRQSVLGRLARYREPQSSHRPRPPCRRDWLSIYPRWGDGRSQDWGGERVQGRACRRRAASLGRERCSRNPA
ncbi:hypothetical protein F5Y18DRAFT_390917 [Xylariaceae sp. FL1019]|nr:hypothetical protein F5Y18DRAFT_390917 [Xylariaceae sp. FL1019]